MLRWKNFLTSVVPSLRSVVTFHPVDINKKLGNVKEEKYQRSFSEILNDIALLGAKLINSSFPWELSFVLKP